MAKRGNGLQIAFREEGGGGDYGEKKEGEKRVGHNDCRRLDEFGKLKMVSVRMLYPKPP